MNYIGSQTKMALKNFPFPYHKVPLDLIYAITEIKIAAALAHKKIGELRRDKADSIVRAGNEILKGTHDDQFTTSALQGGAGTSINMNVNEVIALRASELLNRPEIQIHPNDDVNKSQSTNDVNPSALRIVAIRKMSALLNALDDLITTLEQKGKQCASIKKLARTHIQDALPTTLGAEMIAYSEVLKRDRLRIAEAVHYMHDLNLGGTAIGNSISASTAYIKEVYIQLSALTKLPLRKGKNFMSLTGSQSDFYHMSASLIALALDISKIASDIRFLSSGPNGGIGEIALEALQPGSSIMPGKVNPVIPESLNQVYYILSGQHLTIEHACENSHLELGIMFPSIADALISNFDLLTTGTTIFNEKCIKLIKPNRERALQWLESSTAYATLLVPQFGYDLVSSIVKESIEEKKTIREIILKKKLLSAKEFEALIRIKD